MSKNQAYCYPGSVKFFMCKIDRTINEGVASIKLTKNHTKKV